MKKISEIYEEYKIIGNLQDHMLRVAAVASIICDNSIELLPNEDIVTACLLHDIGNILKFKWNTLVEFLEPQGLEYWQNVQKEYVAKYGTNDYEATLKILNEVGVSKKSQDIVANWRVSTMPTFLTRPLEVQIAMYSDNRVDPYGIVTVEKRLLEEKKRRNDAGRDYEEEARIFLEAESAIFAKCKIKPEDITNETVAPIIEKLRNFVVK